MPRNPAHRLGLLFLIMSICLCAAGCALRPHGSVPPAGTPVTEAPEITPAPVEAVPTEIPVTPEPTPAPPVLNAGAEYLFPDERGFLRPEDPFTALDVSTALRALVSEADLSREAFSPWLEGDDTPLTAAEFAAFLEVLSTPEEAEQACSFLSGEDESVTRAEAARCLSALAGAVPKEDRYFPDVAPGTDAYEALLAATGPGTLDKDAFMEETLDGFLWFDGYLYRLDEDGYFVTGRELDGLTYDKTGRHTTGNGELDDFVAETLRGLIEPDKTRLELLRAVYLHVKNDFRYLVRNYYASGETGWDVEEALTMFRTGKGNCYNYTGAFCYLARGLGYNAVTYSGTMGTQNQPHSWTEITLDGQIYICDPEIELNYWLLEIYTDNFMMKKENSGSWNYQSVGRS